MPAPQREQLRRALEVGGRLAQVLQRVPEDDRRPPASSLDLGEIALLDVGALRVALEARRAASARRQRVEQRAIAGADV